MLQNNKNLNKEFQWRMYIELNSNLKKKIKQ